MSFKFFRVAREGKTADSSGREITAQQIDQMAANYDSKIYGARIWLEHVRGLFPDSQFKALGDVVALKAETDETGRRVLLAALNPTSDLVKMNQDRQKIYTSIELDTSFSDTGEAYLVGLAVTDSPASTGTEALMLNAMNNKPDSLFSTFIETKVLFSDGSLGIGAEAETEADAPSFLSKVKSLFSQHDDKIDSLNEDTKVIFTDIKNAVEFGIDALQKQQQSNVQALSRLQNELDAFKSDISNTPAEPDTFNRQPATGGDGVVLTDC